MEVDGDGWRWMEVDGDVWRWMEIDGDVWRWVEMGGDHGAPPFRQDEKEISQEIRVVDNRVKNRLGIQEMVKEESGKGKRKRKAKKESGKGKRKRKAEKESGKGKRK